MCLHIMYVCLSIMSVYISVYHVYVYLSKLTCLIYCVLLTEIQMIFVVSPGEMFDLDHPAVQL